MKGTAMVATRLDNVAFVTGRRKYTLAAHMLTPEEWEKILLSAAETLTLDFLRGYVSIPQILRYRDMDNGRLQIEHEPEKLKAAGIDEKDVWLVCAFIQATPLPRLWPKNEKTYRTVPEQILLLKRIRRYSPDRDTRPRSFEFHMLTSRMRLIHRPNEDRWMKATSHSLKAVELLDVLNGTGDALTQFGCQMLKRLARAQLDTLQDLAARREAAEFAADQLAGFSERLGRSLETY
jgi:hypothetical protein